MKKTLVGMLVVLLSLTPVLAQDGGGEGEEEFDVVAALKKVTELLTKSEKLLVESLRPKEGAATGAAAAGEGARKAIEDLLRDSRQSGEDAVAKMMEILEKAPSGGGGGGQDQEKPKPGDDEKRKAEEKKLAERDPQNQEKGGKPDSPRDSKDPASDKDETKPPSGTGKPADPDPEKDWLATLPEQVRQAYLNKDWGRIPQRWREYVEEYVKKLSELESTRRGD